jgi:hypothetical protein
MTQGIEAKKVNRTLQRVIRLLWEGKEEQATDYYIKWFDGYLKRHNELVDQLNNLKDEANAEYNAQRGKRRNQELEKSIKAKYRKPIKNIEAKLKRMNASQLPGFYEICASIFHP